MRQLLKGAALCLGMTCLQLPAQVSDPVPDIQSSGITVQLEEFLTIPNSNSGIPRARINMLRELPDGSGRLFVNDLNGPGHIIDGTTTTEFLDMRDEFPDFISSPGKGTGFAAFAFHPEYASNGKFYTNHTERTGSGTVDFAPEFFNSIALEGVLTEWIDSDPTDDVFTGTRREMIRFSFPHSIHDLQDLSFNPTVGPGDPDYGMLYVCVGEGGSMQMGLADNLQHPMAYMGTIFRIDPAGTNGINGQYGIPADNPFASDSTALGEVWVSGFRNPHRISWDRGGDHVILSGDIGEHNIEELNLLEAGNNYGWSVREGTWQFSRIWGSGNVWELPPDDSGYVYPVAQFDHDDAVAIVSGYVYRGTELPELNEQFICGGIAGGRVFLAPVDSLILGRQYPLVELNFVDENGEPTKLVDEIPGTRVDLRFGQDESGRIYILTKADGKIRVMKPFTATSIQKEQTDLAGFWTPNPTSGLIEYQGQQAQVKQVTVLTTDGRLIRTFDSSQADLSGLPSAHYLLNWELSNGKRGSQMVRKE